MLQMPTPSLVCLAVAAAAAAWLIHRYFRTWAMLRYRTIRATLAVRRAARWVRNARDPDARRMARYANAMLDVERTAEFVKGLDRRTADAFGEAGAEAARTIPEYVLLQDDLTRDRVRAAALLASLDEEDVSAITAHVMRGIAGESVTADDVATFLRDERTLMRTQPHLVDRHFDRMEARFNAIAGDRDGGAAGPLA